MTPDLQRGRHCFFALNVHLVFVTKYRRSIFTDEHLMTIRASAEKVCGDFGACLREFNGERNHVHLLVSYPPKVSISSLVNSLKGVTSRILRTRFPELETSYCKGKLWSPSYFAASCGGAPLEKLKAFIDSQNRPDCVRLHLRASPYIPVMNDGALQLVLVTERNEKRKDLAKGCSDCSLMELLRSIKCKSLNTPFNSLES